ncbi:hypothetical protein OS493_008187 [Desmophyllum pertusum]|uniref:Uncharacterized protein n=1 Tax=Desmophyllum pertusum TaxID=174260 RepID=A0A9X0A3T5_9CNID|nr:hypothetical protein OS493_008187 [Desmophyllum pertusum]
MAASLLYMFFLSLILVSSVFSLGFRSSKRVPRSQIPSRIQRQRSNDVQCGGDLTADSGVIKSPRYPVRYPDEVNCEWKIVVDDGSRITLTFVDFEVEPSNNCEYDSLEVYNGQTQESANQVAKLCGNQLPDPIVSRGPQLFLRFHSDFSVGMKGFKLQFTKSGCSRTFEGESGEIKSPNHPDSHPVSLDCSYLICVPRGKLVSLRFTHFDLEPSENSTGCVYDYIEIFDGKRTDDPNLGRYCGGNMPAQIRSSSNELLVKFISDQSIAHSGFAASYTAESTAVVNPCTVNNGGCSDICSRTNDGRVCLCKPGFSLDFDGVTCKDFNECIINNGGCLDVCVNTDGGFQCKCRDGYVIDTDNKTCINENECASGSHNCEQMCRDTEGSYYCECHKGYRIGVDRITCQDVDECRLPKSFHHCQHACINTPGSYYCTCNKGFRLSANGKICRDEDECLMGGTKCEQQCVNIPGSFYCDCYRGYHLDDRLPHKCVDTDECLEGRPDCHTCFNLKEVFVICVNTEGAYLCECSPGYNATDPESLNCEDIDECAKNNGKGDCDYACANSAGSFRCSCAKCVNKQGSHSCSCFDGYVNSGPNGTDVICIDIDECFDEIHECDSLANCHNTPGNYSCQCPDGYTSQWKDCVDNDECIQPEVHQCEQVCNNTPGSFHCRCREGFSINGDNKTCSDIDECKLNKCEKGCVNTVGSYQCLCPPGYQLASDGHHCEDVDECLDSNGGCDQRCVNENGSYSCACRHGFKLLRDGSTCRDIDECLLNTACCNQDCVNTEGSYNCTCYQGYTANSNCTCIDFNECQTDKMEAV